MVLGDGRELKKLAIPRLFIVKGAVNENRMGGIVKNV